MNKDCFLLFAGVLFGSGAWGQSRFEFWPGAVYDPAVPTAQKVLGYDFGERIASHADIVKYFNALAAAEPARVKIFEYGKTWEGRQLIYAVIGSEANLRRLPEIRSGMQKLHDPRKTSAAEAQKLIQGLPSILWLAYGVHGNEISSPDAAMVTAYHLLAARNDKMVANVLANTLTPIPSPPSIPRDGPAGAPITIRSISTAIGSVSPSPKPSATSKLCRNGIHRSASICTRWAPTLPITSLPKPTRITPFSPANSTTISTGSARTTPNTSTCSASAISPARNTTPSTPAMAPVGRFTWAAWP
jgi:hypothetical protein